MTIVLRNQLEASERSAVELEAQIHAPISANVYDVEDQLRSLVDIFTNLTRDVERWQNALPVGAQGNVLSQQELDWEKQFHRLAALFAGAGKLVQSLNRSGSKVEGEQAFESAWRQLRGIISISRDQVTAGCQQIQRGEVRPLAEVLDELSDRIVD